MQATVEEQAPSPGWPLLQSLPETCKAAGEYPESETLIDKCLPQMVNEARSRAGQ